MPPNRTPPARAVERQARLLTEVAQVLWHLVSQERQPADVALAALFREHKEYGSRDRRLLANGVFAFFRWKGWLDQLQIPDWGIALATACVMDNYMDEPAVKSLVEHAQAMGFDPAATVQRTRLLPLARLFPNWLTEALLPELAQGEAFNQLAKTMQQRPPAWLRCQQGRQEPVFEALAQHKINALQHPRIPTAISIASPVNLDLIRRDTGSVFEVQDLASQCVGILCDAQPGQRWWDVCAGSGGKALHLADLMANVGEILATDIRETALKELTQRARRAGARAIRPRLLASHIDLSDEGPFDGILVDAPCSGIGTWPRNPDARWRTDARDLAERAVTQRKILDDAAPHLRPGGVLVYSVCTLTKAETADIVASFLEDHGDFELQHVGHPLAMPRKHEHRTTLTILPSDGPCGGMFVARFRRRL